MRYAELDYTLLALRRRKSAPSPSLHSCPAQQLIKHRPEGRKAIHSDLKRPKKCIGCAGAITSIRWLRELALAALFTAES